jgi:diguanylate cyclase (GGDEF)-like protein
MLIAPVAVVGAGAAAAAVWRLAVGDVSTATLAAVAVLAFAAVLAEAFPVPMESLPGGNLSLTAIVVAGAAVLYGWRASTLVACATPLALELVQRRGRLRLAYNAGAYALAGAAGGIAAAPVRDGTTVAETVAAVALASVAFYAVTVVLVSAAIARAGGTPFLPMLAASARWTAPPFALMASVSLMLVVLWRQSPVLAGALAGPVIATALYQRSTHRLQKATRLALTDPVTGLGNHRHFHELLERTLESAAAAGEPVSLCLLDLDDFKQVNDTHGHPAGDGVLAQVGDCLRGMGEGFRLGGDEFALVLPGRSKAEARQIVKAALARLAALEVAGVPVTVSAGLATYPDHAESRSALVAAADAALYGAKRAGKDHLRVAPPSAPPLAAAG